MKEIIQRVKGVREFYPEDMAFRTWLYGNISAVSRSFGYQEYDGPFLEKLELYAAKSGEELVKEQAFVFTDRAGGEITLRPELTPSLARMVAQRQRTLVYPLRLWSFGPFWRYEQPQKGRTREFFQWNIDMLGSTTAAADAELIAICAALFKRLGLTPEHVRINVNNRRLMDKILQEYGIGADKRAIAYRLIDRRDKLRADAWHTYALENGLNDAEVDALIKILMDHELWKQSEELVAIFALMEKMGYAEYLSYDPQVIRGILYYTGTVFEARDAAKDGRAILGGGRYENLVADVGGDALSGVGFAMGDVMMNVILEKYGLLPHLDVQPAQVVVTCFDAACLSESFAIATQLRANGVNTLCYPEAVKLDKQLKFANRINAKAIVIAGPDELNSGQVVVKDLQKRVQTTLARADAATFIKREIL